MASFSGYSVCQWRHSLGTRSVSGVILWVLGLSVASFSVYLVCQWRHSLGTRSVSGVILCVLGLTVASFSGYSVCQWCHSLCTRSVSGIILWVLGLSVASFSVYSVTSLTRCLPVYLCIAIPHLGCLNSASLTLFCIQIQINFYLASSFKTRLFFSFPPCAGFLILLLFVFIINFF